MTIRLHTPLARNVADIIEVIHIFYPDARVETVCEGEADLRHVSLEEDGWTTETFTWGKDRFAWTVSIQGDAWEQKRRRKRAVKQACYLLLRRRTGTRPPWGSLTGIRPTRLLYERLQRGYDMEDARRSLMAMFDLQAEKASLLEETVRAQRGLLSLDENAIDIYVGIPFCTTRCAYCSFFAEAIGKGKKVPAYLEALFKEMDETADMVHALGLTPRALYVGGGTPTALRAEQLFEVLKRLREQYPKAVEFSVEAGRPDTIDRKMLDALIRSGATRISINPQTMQDRTLARIGRAHNAADTRTAFRLARSMGFDNINMDLIAALPGETMDDFRRTLKAVSELAPDSLTVHTLARKHGSRLNEFGFEPTEGKIAGDMVAMAHAMARAMAMRPYYMYRQKYVAGNLENVAYARPGAESIYNIDIMEETTSVLAMGAGGISKRVFLKEGRIERAPNVGDVGTYIARTEEMIARKRRLWKGE